MSLNILLLTPQMLKERSTIHDNIDDKLIYPEIKAVQDMYIQRVLGSALYNKILADINGNVLTDPYKSLVDNYVIDCLFNYVLSELPSGLNYQMWNKGVSSKTTDNSSTASMSDMWDIVAKYKNRAEFYQDRLIKYLLQQNSKGLFPEYNNPGSGIDTIIPDRNGFTSPIYLGDDYGGNTKPSYESLYQGNIVRNPPY